MLNVYKVNFYIKKFAQLKQTLISGGDYQVKLFDCITTALLNQQLKEKFTET